MLHLLPENLYTCSEPLEAPLSHRSHNIHDRRLLRAFLPVFLVETTTSALLKDSLSKRTHISSCTSRQRIETRKTAINGLLLSNVLSPAMRSKMTNINFSTRWNMFKCLNNSVQDILLSSRTCFFQFSSTLNLYKDFSLFSKESNFPHRLLAVEGGRGVKSWEFSFRGDSYNTIGDEDVVGTGACFLKKLFTAFCVG